MSPEIEPQIHAHPANIRRRHSPEWAERRARKMSRVIRLGDIVGYNEVERMRNERREALKQSVEFMTSLQEKTNDLLPLPSTE